MADARFHGTNDRDWPAAARRCLMDPTPSAAVVQSASYFSAAVF